MTAEEENWSNSQSDRSRNRVLLDRRDYLKYTGTAAIGSLATTGSATAAKSVDDRSDAGRAASPTDLRVEYEHRPNNLQPDGNPPRFFWELSTDPRGTIQTAYRILVADSASALRNEDGNVWDSGRVESGQSTAIEYAGPTLDPDTTYHWIVRIWNHTGTASDWSEPSSFSTALPNTDDAWDGTWIGQASEDGRPGTDWTDYTLEMDIMVVNGAAGPFFRAQDADNFYMWQINTAQGPAPLLRPHIRANGSWQVLDPVSLEEVMGDDPHGQHRLRIDIDGDQFTTYIDGQQVDQRTDSTHAQGSIGFRQYAGGGEHGRYDNLEVTEPNGDVLFSDTFDHEYVQHFTAGTIVDGQLDLDSTGVVFLGEKRLESPLLRAETTLDGSIAEARAHVITLGYGELYINGERIGNEKLNPAWTFYGDCVLYTTHDIGDVLREGNNAIGLWLGRGWFSKSISNWNSFGAPRALMQLNITYEDGRTDAVVTNTSWRLGRGPIGENDIYDGETYDARREQSGWATPGFDDGDWNPAKESAPPGDDVKRRPQRTQPIEVTETLEPDSITKREDGHIVDFGQNHTGWVELSINGADAGDKITIKHAEILENRGTRGEDDPDDVVVDDWEMLPGGSGDIYTGNLRSADQTDVYIAKGADAEVYEPRFTYHGFRYAKVIGYPGELTADDIRSKVVHTGFEKAGSFAISSDDLQRVQESSVWSQRSLSQSLPIDCPQRNERMGWTGDAHMTARAQLFNFDTYRMFEKYMDDHDANQSPEGTQTDTIPHAYGGRPADPNWARTRVTMPWFMYLHSGDHHVLSERYEGMKKYVDYWSQTAENHIIPGEANHYGDWLAPKEAHISNDLALLNTFSHYQTTDILAQIAETLGKKDDAEQYRSRAEAIAEAFNNEFFDSTTNSYGSGDQTAYALPLFAGIVPDSREDEVVEGLVSKIRTDADGKIGTGFVGTRPLLFTLVEHGYIETAYHIVSQPEEPGWVFMVRNGATTQWERWDAPDYGPGLNSLNHRNWTLISEWFYRVLAGINIAEPGFERINITPYVVDNLDHAGGEIDTIRGTVASRWERMKTPGKARTRDGLALDVTIPGNTTATVRIPTLSGEKVRVRESGKSIWNNGHRTGRNHPGVREIRRDGDRVVVEVGSGEYQFELEQLGKARK
jgi:alpha-L-rhamnosidase